MLRRSAGFALVLLSTTSVHADDLAALAKREKERRAKLSKPSPVITETDTKVGAGSVSVVGAAPTPPLPPRTGPSAEEQRATWKARADAARAEIHQAEMLLAQLGWEFSAYQADMDEVPAAELQDPMRKQKRAARLEELKRGLDQQRQVLANAKTSLSVLEDAARVNGVPPGWLR